MGEALSSAAPGAGGGDRRESVLVVRARPIGMPSVETARVERRGRSLVTVALPGQVRLLVPTDAQGQPRASGQVRGVFEPGQERQAHALALAELRALRQVIDAQIRQSELAAGMGAV